MGAKIKITASELDAIDSLYIPDADRDYKDAAGAWYDALVRWAESAHRDDVLAAAPDGHACPRSFDRWWENDVTIEGGEE